MPNRVQINKTLFTTTMDTATGIKTVPDDICEKLLSNGWQVISRTKKTGMKVIVYRRPSK